MSARVCASCGCRVERERVAEASRPWRHVDLEGAGSRAARSCSGATLIAPSALVRVDDDPESDAPWSVFVDVNRDAGLSLEEIGDIEETIATCGVYVGHHDADVGLVSHLDRLLAEQVVFDAPIDAVRDFAIDFWDRGDPSEALDVDVRRYVVDVLVDGIADGNITRAQLPTLFARRDEPESWHTDRPSDRSPVGADFFAVIS